MRFLALTILVLFTSTANSQIIVLSERGSRVQNQIHSAIHSGINIAIDSTYIEYSENDISEVIGSIYENGYSDKIISLSGDPINVERIASEYSDDPKLIHGGHSLSGIDNISGVSLLINPDKILSALKSSNGSVTRVKSVISHEYDAIHLEVIKEAALNHDIEFLFNVASGPAELAKLWQNTLENIDADTDAVLVLDTIFMDEIKGLNFILKSAWRNKFIIATTVPAYTPRGVSIGVAPNLSNYGQSLARHAMSVDDDEIKYLQSYLPALSVKSLGHSGIYVSGMFESDEAVLIE